MKGSPMTEDLKAEFHKAMLNTYDVAAKQGYRATYFLRMVSERGGWGAAKQLLSTSEEQTGLTRLWELDLLHISVEALVQQEPWAKLFSDAERQTALDRLKSYRYFDER